MNHLTKGHFPLGELELGELTHINLIKWLALTLSFFIKIKDCETKADFNGGTKGSL